MQLRASSAKSKPLRLNYGQSNLGELMGMAKSREHITHSGKAAFYACIWPDLMKTALDNGWAFGIHGSLQSDLDIMAMPWIEEACPLDVLIDNIRNLFTDPGGVSYRVDTTSKPNNRAVITIWIWADFYLDINVIMPFKLSVDNPNPFYTKGLESFTPPTQGNKQ